ncbi:hypothetical protein F511_23431 [Dorcoceras hygrometricum]|uniref:Uncharacterized protein n=1 Tax=Dorcoceras hygrometricum TaxID=472368 RepID=A0A2Z7DF45_9LAMI|nr:hypothetical protein F511_23431 [Dorcoceras hygrometricum]
MNWAKFLFGVLKKMVSARSKQAKGFAIQISVLLATFPALRLGESSEFPSSKVLTNCAVLRFVSINDRDGAEEVTGAAKKKLKEDSDQCVVGDFSFCGVGDGAEEVTGAAKKKAVSKKRPAADVEAAVPKKKRTIKKKYVSSISSLEMVAVAEEAVPIQQVLDETRAADAPADIAQPAVTEEKHWFDLPYDDLIKQWEAERPVVTASDTEDEIATEDVAPADGVQQVENVLAPISTVDTISADEQMSLDDILLSIPVDIPLPSTCMEVTKIKMGQMIKIPGVSEKTWFLNSLPSILADDKGKEVLVEKDPIKGNPAKEHYSLSCADIDLLVDLRAKVIAERCTPISLSGRKNQMKIPFRLLCDILAKAISVKAGSFNAITVEKFSLMTVVVCGVKMNWAKFLFGVLKKMVTAGSNQAKGFAIQISVLLATFPSVELGESSEFPASKILSKKAVLRFVSINDRDGAEEVTGAAKKKAVSKKRPAADVEAAVPKKKRTIKKKYVSSISSLEMVAVAEEAVPIQQGSPRDRGAVIARSNSNTRSLCWIRRMLLIDGLWAVEFCDDRWVKIPKRIFSTEVPLQRQYDDTLPTMSVFFKLLRKRWADVCLEAVEFCAQRLLPVGSTQSCRSLQLRESVSSFAPTKPTVFAVRVSQFCSVFVNMSLFSWLSSTDISEFLCSIALDKTILRSVQSVQNSFSVAPRVQLALEQQQSSSSSSSSSSLHFDQTDFDATASSRPTFSPDLSAVFADFQAALSEQIFASQSDISSRMHKLEQSVCDSLRDQADIFKNLVQGARQEVRTLDDVHTIRFNEFHKNVFQGLADVRQVVDSVNAKVDIMAKRVNDIQKDAEATKEALSHQLLEFQSSAQENHNVIHAQLSDLVNYIHRGSAEKKGESGSRGLQKPANTQK